jgi:hypothetical protein
MNELYKQFYNEGYQQAINFGFDGKNASNYADGYAMKKQLEFCKRLIGE